MRGIPANKTPSGRDGSVWEKFLFPTGDFPLSVSGRGFWLGKGATLSKPFCWTPTAPVYFGGKRLIPLYPCIAFESSNFGWVLQRGPNGIVVAKE